MAIPTRCPDDSIMATAEARRALGTWVAATFFGAESGPNTDGADEPGTLLLGHTPPPFSFLLGNRPANGLVSTWQRTAHTTKDGPECAQHTAQWTDPATGLRVTAEVRVFSRYAAVEWLLYLENTGTTDTPILEHIQSLDLELNTNDVHQPVILHGLTGDVCSDRSFAPFDTSLAPGENTRMTPVGGRSSNGAFPFFNVRHGDLGVITAVGWSGQWAVSLERAESGPTRLRAGMEQTHLRLHPGERIRGPRILLMPWCGDLDTAHNRFRRLMLFEYAPRIDGHPPRLPLALQCFDRYSQTRPEWATEAGQIAAARVAHALGADHLWLDAAWFVGGFPNGVGNWRPKPEEFPRGLRPIADKCHELGLHFIVWFEPERVAPGSDIARNHPEFVFGGADGGLFKLGDPAARAFLTDLLSRRIVEFDLDVYRNDFNIDPLPFWRANDAPDRQGMTEIRYIEGLYELWDTLRARRPGLLIDNCASGGRRIDLETCARSVPLWRSDTNCFPDRPDWKQAHTQGLSLYIPLHTACTWSPDPYDVRSTMTGGFIAQFDYLAPGFPADAARAAFAEAKENRQYWCGDFYSLTPPSVVPDVWAVYQFHRPDLDAGLVLFFRRARSIYEAARLRLRGLDPDTRYRVRDVDDKTSAETRTGRELMQHGLSVEMATQPTARLLVYERS